MTLFWRASARACSSSSSPTSAGSAGLPRSLGGLPGDDDAPGATLRRARSRIAALLDTSAGAGVIDLCSEGRADPGATLAREIGAPVRADRSVPHERPAARTLSMTRETPARSTRVASLPELDGVRTLFDGFPPFCSRTTARARAPRR